jgi:hypothetical protein
MEEERLVLWGEAELLLYCPHELNETMKWQRIQVRAFIVDHPPPQTFLSILLCGLMTVVSSPTGPANLYDR